jgi:anaphase-promoting complex subunit 1
MRNVNLSVDEQFNESWILREVFKQNSGSHEELAFLTPHIVNSEEELYFSGHTAVWSRGKEKSSAEVCYTTENPIRFAFFCTPNFLNPEFKIEAFKGTEHKDNQGIAIVDCNSLKVFSKNGENLITSVEYPINQVWITKFCILLEKDASTTFIDGHQIPMPRVFSLTHALDDMFPVLLKAQNIISYISEDEYKVNQN